ncbi:hypothetical protein MKZ38_005700 [Zalerion maritima]|uniref:Uncharacterized protein n=1 Tax=Zalerion maritima TaxID=339359 RepID=A0AAD5RKS0_9PEZI|nr:hypothetical protein MKZ38_005700 [Zalerion maritima]
MSASSSAAGGAGPGVGGRAAAKSTPREAPLASTRLFFPRSGIPAGCRAFRHLRARDRRRARRREKLQQKQQQQQKQQRGKRPGEACWTGGGEQGRTRGGRKNDGTAAKGRLHLDAEVLYP